MYTPKHFTNSDHQEVRRFIKENAFGMLVTSGDRLRATHLPLLMSDDEKILSGHIARANPQTKVISSLDEVMVIFPGPHAYISSSWYDHENVPTWNYIAVHVYGKPRVIEGNELYEALRKIVDKYEESSESPVSVERMNAKYLDAQMKAIVGFEITITSIEASYKLSQNRNDFNYDNIVKHLEKSKSANALAVAAEMKKRR